MVALTDSTTEYEIINGRKIVKKHVATIHCSNKLSLLERKISNALLYHAVPKLNQELMHTISIAELRQLLNFNSNNTKALKDAIRSLISTVIEWNLLGDDVDMLEGWNATTILASVTFKEGVCSYQYSEVLKKLLVDPKVYGRVNLIVQSRFKSAYGLALYENCVRYRGLPQTKRFPYATFRKLMGVQDDQYQEFKYFNRRVLSPAVAEINACADISIVPDIQRKGRKVDSIMFYLKERPMKQRIGVVAQDDSNVVISAELKRIVDEFGLSSKKIQNLQTQYGDEKLLKTYEYVKHTKSFRAGEINNLAGYFLNALKKDYQPKSSSALNKIHLQKVADEKARKEDEKRRAKEMQLQQEKLERDYMQYRIDFISTLLDNLDKAEKESFIERAVAQLNSQGIFGAKIARELMDAQAVGAQSLSVMETFLREDGLLETLESFDQFISEKNLFN